MRSVLGIALTTILVTATVPPRAEAQALSTGAGALGGLLAGSTVTMGIIVTRAHVEEKFMESTRDMVSPIGLPVVAGLALGATLGASDPDRLRTVGAWTGAGLVVGTGLGVGWATLFADEKKDRWAGGVIGAASGVLVGGIVGALVHSEDGEDPGSSVDLLTVRIPTGSFR